jgi:hypothetical protein
VGHARLEYGERHVKKGRHRRFEEARALKRSNEAMVEPCPECGADPEGEHASWCLATEDDEDHEDLEAGHGPS